MKVLVITTVRFRQNGITSVIMNYYRKLNDEVNFDFIGPNEISIEYQDEFNETNSSYFQLKNRKKNPISYMFKLYKIMKKHNYDVVHVHGSSHLIALELFIAKLAKVNMRIAHSHNTECDHNFLHRILTPLFNFSYTDAIACGKQAGKWLFNEDEFIVLNNGINLEKFKFDYHARKNIREELLIQENDFVIGNVAGFLPVKNHEFIIKVAQKLVKQNKKYKFLLLGDGELFEKTKNMVNESGLQDNVIMLGNCLDAYKYYNAMDLFLLPSFYEGLPVVLIEAQANGLWSLISNTITTDVDITKSIIFCSLDEDISKWIEQIEYIENNYSHKHTEYSKKGCQKLEIDGYSIDSNATKLLEIYRK